MDEDLETRRRRLERIEAEKKARQEKEVRRQSEAARKAREALENAPDADDTNPYLRRKGVRPCAGLKADGQDLLVPVLDEKGAVTSLQRIQPNGQKRFLPGGRVRGCLFQLQGSGGPLYVVEGIATGMSVHMATGGTVLVAFSASNLERVARIGRARFPEREIVICADNDLTTQEKTGRNPGLEEATKAAEAVGGRVVVPDIDGDMNDVHQRRGLGGVRRLLSYSAPIEVRRTSRG